MTSKKKDMSELIPDYCNDRLDARQKADFEWQLQEDQELLEEYNDFRKLRDLYRQIDHNEPSPSDALFSRISSNIATQQQHEKDKRGDKTVRSGQLMAAIRNFWQQVRASVAVPWVLAGIQAAVIVLLLVSVPRENTYSTLSSTEKVAESGRPGINVVFAPSARESDIRSLLLTIHGSVSGGPSMEGRYVVSISNENDLDGALLKLKQSEFVVFAEPVY